MVQSSNPHDLYSRAAIIKIAREWIGTPYMHQASRKHIGCDCLGLLRGIWKNLYGVDAERPPNYTPSWAEVCPAGQEPMLEAARMHLIEIAYENILPGDVILIRVRNQSAIKHCGIYSYDDHIIHAYDRHSVLEEPMRPAWKRKNLYAFQFPGVTD